MMEKFSIKFIQIITIFDLLLPTVARASYLEKSFELSKVFSTEEIEKINQNANNAFPYPKPSDRISQYCFELGFEWGILGEKNLDGTKTYFISCRSKNENKSDSIRFDFASRCSDQELNPATASAKDLIEILEKIKEHLSPSDLNLGEVIDKLFPKQTIGWSHKDTTKQNHKEIRYYFKHDYHDQDSLIKDILEYYIKKLKSYQAMNRSKEDVDPVLSTIKLINKEKDGLCAGLSCTWVYGNKLFEIEPKPKGTKIPSIEAQKEIRLRLLRGYENLSGKEREEIENYFSIVIELQKPDSEIKHGNKQNLLKDFDDPIIGKVKQVHTGFFGTDKNQQEILEFKNSIQPGKMIIVAKSVFREGEPGHATALYQNTHGRITFYDPNSKSGETEFVSKDKVPDELLQRMETNDSDLIQYFVFDIQGQENSDGNNSTSPSLVHYPNYQQAELIKKNDSNEPQFNGIDPHKWGEPFKAGGVIWSKIATNEDGRVMFMHQRDPQNPDAPYQPNNPNAIAYCKSIGGRLPTKEELSALRRENAVVSLFERGLNLPPPAQMHDFWSSSMSSKNSRRAIVFEANYSNDSMTYDPTWAYKAVFCVR